MANNQPTFSTAEKKDGPHIKLPSPKLPIMTYQEPTPPAATALSPSFSGLRGPSPLGAGRVGNIVQLPPAAIPPGDHVFATTTSATQGTTHLTSSTSPTLSADSKTLQKHGDQGTSLLSPSASSQNLRPALTRNTTSQNLSASWSGIKRNFSSSGVSIFSHQASGSISRETSAPSTPRSIFAQSRNSSFGFGGSRTPTVPNSPQLQAMLKQETVPDLNSVNKALEQVQALPDNEHSKVEFIGRLIELAGTLKGAQDNCKQLLSAAMKARDDGKPEVCRSLCLQVVQNAHSEVPTKVYAYNILATQASSGQAVKYLDDATKLVKRSMKDTPEYETLLGAIDILRKSACDRRVKTKDHVIAPKQHEHGQRADQSGTERVEQAVDRGDAGFGIAFGRIPLKDRNKGMTVQSHERDADDGDEGLEMALSRRTEAKIAQAQAKEHRVAISDFGGLETPVTRRKENLTLQLPRPALSSSMVPPQTESSSGSAISVEEVNSLAAAIKIGSQADGKVERHSESLAVASKIGSQTDGKMGSQAYGIDAGRSQGKLDTE